VFSIRTKSVAHRPSNYLYIILYRQTHRRTDAQTHRRIDAQTHRQVRNHNIADVDSSITKSACNLCTNTPPNFFLIDMKTGNLKERFRMNFLNFLDFKAEGFIEPTPPYADIYGFETRLVRIENTFYTYQMSCANSV
jgi:hypothetical protein